MRRLALILLVAAVLAGGIATGRRFSGKRAATSAVAKAAVVATEARARPRVALPRGAEAASAARRIEAIAAARETARLSQDDAAVLAETCELQMLAQGTDLTLDSGQWTKLAGVTLELDAIRQAYEAEIATAVAVEPRKFRVEIPSYAGAGAALRAKFYAELDRALGTAAAADVADRIGARLESRFGGFGLSVQTLDIAAGPKAEDCVVTRTVTYAVDGANGARVATRSETYLPAWEDPSGERWGAMLARVGM